MKKIFFVILFLLFPAVTYSQSQEKDPHWYFLRTLNQLPAGIACTYTSPKIIKPTLDVGASCLQHCANEFLMLKTDDEEYGKTGKLKRYATLNIDQKDVFLKQIFSSKKKVVFKSKETTLIIKPLKYDSDGNNSISVEINHEGKILKLLSNGSCDA